MSEKIRFMGWDRLAVEWMRGLAGEQTAFLKAAEHHHRPLSQEQRYSAWASFIPIPIPISPLSLGTVAELDH
jgi:hypothetical protein